MKTVFRSGIHPAICIFVPFLFNLTFVQALFTMIPDLPSPPLLFTMLFLVSLSACILGNIFRSTRTGTGARIRELLITCMAVYAYASLFNAGSSRFAPQPSNVLPVLCSAFQWFLTVELQSRLRGREDFLALTAGVTGEKLQNVLREYQFFSVTVVQELKSIRLFLSALLLALCFLLVLLKSSTGRVPFTILASFFAFSLLYFGLRVLITLFLEEFRDFGNGISIPPRLFAGRLARAGILLGTCAAVSAFLASDRAVLPSSILLAFFRRLSSLFRFHPSQIPLSEGSSSGTDALHRMLEQYRPEPVLIPVWVKFLFAFLKNLVIVSAAAALVFLFLRPFFSADFRAYLARVKPFRVLRMRIRIFLEWIADIFTGGETASERSGLLESAGKGSTGDAGRLDRTSAEAKRRETNRIIREFLRILKWGKRQGIAYAQGQTPGEYADRITAVFPESDPLLRSVVDVFEEALFSSHLTDGTVLETYQENIRKILRVRKP